MQAHQPHHTSMYCFIYIVSVIAYTTFQHVMMYGGCDAPWHVASGSLIMEMGVIPVTDPWSFTAGDSRWYNLSWLFDVGVAWVHDNISVKALIALNILVVSSIPVLIARLCFMRGCSLLATLMVVSLAIVWLRAGVTIRPQQSTLLLLGAMLWVLYQFREKQSKWIWLIPLIALIWANIHGSYLMVFAVLGSFFIEACLGRDISRAKTYVLVGIACLFAILINPYGYEIFYASWLTLGGEYSQDYISEWRAGKITSEPRVYLPLMLMMGLAFYTRVKIPAADVILAIFWGLMAIHSVRYGVISTVFIAPVLGLMITGAISKFERVTAREKIVCSDLSDRGFRMTLSYLAVIIVLCYLIPQSYHSFIKDDIYNPKAYPKDAITYLAENHPGSNVLNEYCYGSYIIYQARGSIKPFIDTRLDSVYPEHVKNDHFKKLFRTDWEDVAERYDITLAIFGDHEKSDSRRAFEKAGWETIFEGKIAKVYKKRDAK